MGLENWACAGVESMRNITGAMKGALLGSLDPDTNPFDTTEGPPPLKAQFKRPSGVARPISLKPFL